MFSICKMKCWPQSLRTIYSEMLGVREFVCGVAVVVAACHSHESKIPIVCVLRRVFSIFAMAFKRCDKSNRIPYWRLAEFLKYALNEPGFCYILTVVVFNFCFLLRCFCLFLLCLSACYLDALTFGVRCFFVAWYHFAKYTCSPTCGICYSPTKHLIVHGTKWTVFIMFDEYRSKSER